MRIKFFDFVINKNNTFFVILTFDLRIMIYHPFFCLMIKSQLLVYNYEL